SRGSVVELLVDRSGDLIPALRRLALTVVQRDARCRDRPCFQTLPCDGAVDELPAHEAGRELAAGRIQDPAANRLGPRHQRLSTAVERVDSGDRPGTGDEAAPEIASEELERRQGDVIP